MGKSGGDEPRPVYGHLGLGEPIVKPTVKGRFFVWTLREADTYQGRASLYVIDDTSADNTYVWLVWSIIKDFRDNSPALRLWYSRAYVRIL